MILDNNGCANFSQKCIYWDTNCYRSLGRLTIQNGFPWLKDFLQKLTEVEQENKIHVKVSYLVLSEMFAHLNDSISSSNYLECKFGLYAAVYHSGLNSSNMLPNPDSEFTEFISGEKPYLDSCKENSLYESIVKINQEDFNDSFIKNNGNTIQQANTFLNTLKIGWKDSFINNYIKKHDTSFAGKWQVFAKNEEKRSSLLKELRIAKRNGSIFREFGTGLYLYVCNTSSDFPIPTLTEKLLSKIIVRFNPLFLLQYRIMELMCQSGYNLDKSINDITDFLILAHLDKGKSVFISNETKHLIPNLRSLGLGTEVYLFDEYCSALNINYK